MSIPFLIPAATIFAAFIAAIVGLISLTVSKEGKISDFRQAWIDSLREDLTQFLAATRIMIRLLEEKRAFALDPEHPNKNIFFKDEDGLKARLKVVECYQRILLRLNASQPDHQKLLAYLDETIQKTGQLTGDSTASPAEVLGAVKIASDSAAAVLKEEWKTVKAGEPTFQLISKVSKYLVGGFAILAVISIAFALGAQSQSAPSTQQESGARCLFFIR
jgi:uncharacterized membrane protein YraQ (UPF0718 family)